MSWTLAHGAFSVGGNIFGKTLKTGLAPIRAARNFVASSYVNKARQIDQIENPHLYENVPFTDRERSSFLRRKGRLAKSNFISHTKSFAIGTALSGGLYGLGAYMTDNDQASAGDRAAHYAKYAVASGVDILADSALTVASFGLATFAGPIGMMAAGGLQMFNMFAGFMGYDAGTLAMNVMDYADEQYDKNKLGPKFNMTQNTTMTMQRQIQNLHASGSNLGEMMHN